MKKEGSLKELLEAEIWTLARIEEGNLLMLRPLGAEQVVSIFIGSSEAQAIKLGLDGVLVERPLTHDLFLKFVKAALFTLNRVEIRDAKNDVFYSRLCFTGPGHDENNPLYIDSRPSDALALAVRAKCPLFVAAKVLAKSGSPIDFVMKGKIESPRSLLSRELDSAVAAEEYERAAEIRDRLNMLEKDDGKKG
jgi:bifunctional DNase/RNase